MKCYTIVIFLSCFISCNTGGINNLELGKINIENFRDKKLDVNDMTSGFRLLPLKLGDNQFIGSIKDICMIGDTIYLLDEVTSTILSFSRNGEIIKSICNKGNGPNEYVNPVAISSNSQNLYVLDVATSRIIEYDQNINAIKSFKLSFPSSDFIALNDGFLFRNLFPTDEFKDIVHIDDNGVYINSFGLSDKNNSTHSTLGNLGDYFIRDEQGRVYISGSYDNLIYEWRDKKLNSRYIIDFGKFNIPSHLSSKLNFFEEPYAFHSNTFVISNTLISSFFYNSKRYYAFSNLLNQNIRIGIVSDSKYSIPFFPQWQIDNKLIGVCNYYEAIKYLNLIENKGEFELDDLVLIFYEVN